MDTQPVKLSFWKKFFIVMGVLFVAEIALIIIAFIYLAVTKPFGIDVTKLPQAIMGGANTSTYDNPIMNTQQEIFLENLGVDTRAVTTITPAQEACAVTLLGKARVDEIKAGSALTTSDYLKAGSCFK